ncbi:MAG: TraB/GumN family protein, partial [Chitinophagaceae bacterium]|nr:TraB/GumN family protein [Chitinophagaceae bacterium]
IQAHSIDSILKSGSSLFVGVGAAHLPGSRGVIEILRRKGYRLRAVITEKRNDSKQKETVEKIHVPVVFNTYNSEDRFFKVDIPGRLYRSDDDYGMSDQQQYADMANGSYYIVTRLRTNNVMWGHSTTQVYKKIDSVLYENIPGKMLSKQVIYKNGYKGFDIINRTRRGDIQRYNIFITPFEIIFFKMSGNDDYVKNGVEAKQFFNSIHLREYGKEIQWKKYSPSFGGFSVNLPHEAFISNDGSWLFDAEDKSDNSRYRIVRSDVHNYHFAEEDTFDLSLMEESFVASEFIDKEISRKFTTQNGYPALDCRFKNKDGSIFIARFVIQGPHYYSLIAHNRQENAKTKNFFDSFEITPFVYGPVKERKDTSLYYTVKSPVFPSPKKEKIEFGNNYDYLNNGDGEENNENDILQKGTYRNSVIEDDSTGQKIYVSFYKSGRYRFEKDSIRLKQKDFRSYLGGDSTWVIRELKKNELPGNTKTWEYVLTKKGSSRIFRKKDFYKNGISFSIVTQSDSLTQADLFEKTFFETFAPFDTLKGLNPFVRKTKYFFEDFFSTDSTARKRAISNIGEIEPGASDLPLLKKAIESFSWKQKKYLDTKKAFISKLRDMATKESSDYLRELYYAAGDTVELQYAALETLLQQQTGYAMNVFSGIISLEPPVLQTKNNTGWTSYPPLSGLAYNKRYHYSNGDFLDELYDSLQLTRAILPGLLPLLNLDDYKWPVMRVLANLADSNLVQAKDYDAYFDKFLLEAKLEWRKQVIAGKKKAIRKAEDDKVGKTASPYSFYDTDGEIKDDGNDELSVYATLLLPYRETNANVQALFQQLLQSPDIKLKYNTMMLLLRNKKAIPDTLPVYFAALDDYRYNLYSDLKELDKLKLFPAKYNNHLDLAYSKLRDSKLYDKPDSLIYVDSLNTAFKGNKGLVYFFKYKQKKDDDVWKLATVGLLPADPTQFEFDEKKITEKEYLQYGHPDNDFTELSDTKIKEDEPIADQLKSALKKILYSTRKSAKEFYDNKDNNRAGVDITRRY